jgi:hypothetical protein
MARGRPEEFNPKRRPVRGHSNRDPFEAQGEPTNPSRAYNPVRSFTEEEDKLSQDYISNYYYEKGY